MKLKLILAILLVLTMFTINSICYGNIETDLNQIEDELNELILIDESEQEVEEAEENSKERNTYNIRNKGEGLQLLGAYKGLTYYSQADSRWANVPYTSIGDYNQTMKSSGCGPTVAAMVVSSSKGEILPTRMANLFVNNGFRTAANGTSWSAFPFIANYFEFDNYEFTTNFITALDYLRKGYYVVASCGNGLFTTNGHFVLLVGVNEDIITIYDPYLYNGKFDTPSRKGKVTVRGNTIYCSINNFEQYANYRAFWCYSNDHGEDINNKVPNNIKYTAGNYAVNTDVLRVRSGPGTNYRIVNRVYRGNIKSIDYTNGNWGHLSDNSGWICLEYCYKTNNATNNNTNKAYSIGRYQTTANLHVRFGPSINYNFKYYNQLTGNARTQNRKLGNYYYNGYKKGVVCDVIKVSGNWGLTRSGWICLDYCRKIS